LNLQLIPSDFILFPFLIYNFLSFRRLDHHPSLHSESSFSLLSLSLKTTLRLDFFNFRLLLCMIYSLFYKRPVLYIILLFILLFFRLIIIFLVLLLLITPNLINCILLLQLNSPILLFHLSTLSELYKYSKINLLGSIILFWQFPHPITIILSL